MTLLHKTITSYLYTTDNDKNVITIIKYLIPVNIPQASTVRGRVQEVRKLRMYFPKNKTTINTVRGRVQERGVQKLRMYRRSSYFQDTLFSLIS